MDLLWLGVAPDCKGPTVASRQAHGDYLVSGQLLAQCLPGGVDTLFEEGALNADQQVIGQHTEKDVTKGHIVRLIFCRVPPLPQTPFSS